MAESGTIFGPSPPSTQPSHSPGFTSSAQALHSLPVVKLPLQTEKQWKPSMDARDHPAAKRRRLDMSGTIIICTGREAKEFTVIESIATRSSKFLQAAMSRDWKEAKEKRVLLPDTETTMFEGYLQLAHATTSSIRCHKAVIVKGDGMVHGRWRGHYRRCSEEWSRVIRDRESQ